VINTYHKRTTANHSRRIKDAARDVRIFARKIDFFLTTREVCNCRKTSKTEKNLRKALVNASEYRGQNRRKTAANATFWLPKQRKIMFGE
jgi:hypothetical protein